MLMSSMDGDLLPQNIPVAPVVPVVPLDQLLVPADLDGRTGRNRSTGPAQVCAPDDRSAVLAWLANYADSPATLASYRKEAERLLLWSLLQHRKAMSDLAHEDLLVYQRFLADPQPADRWIAPGGQRPARSSPAWRPFVGALSPVSQRQAMSVLNSLFSWLVEARYLQGNPIALSRRRRAQRIAPRITRFLPMAHWVEVKRTVETLPTETERQRAHAARARWLLSLLYIGGLRVSEVCTGTMGCFFNRLSPDGRDRWWLEILGKGQKVRLIPATVELMGELTRYRRACGLSPIPSSGEDTPLVLPLIGAAVPMQRTGIHEIIKSLMRSTAERLIASGDASLIAAAKHIAQASTHWLRHTAGSHQSDRVDLKIVRDNLGHSSIATTNTYLHAEDDVRHDATSQAHRAAWLQPDGLGGREMTET